MSDLLMFVALFAIYPVAVLFIALTGPHCPAEIEANARDRLEALANPTQDKGA